MNNKVILENYLLILKSTIEVYIHGTIESSNDKVRSILKLSLNNTLTNQADTYELMVKNNWYKTINISKKEINSAIVKLENN